MYKPRKRISEEDRLWKRINKQGRIMNGMNTQCWEYVPLREISKKGKISISLFINDKKQVIEIGHLAWKIYTGETPKPQQTIIRRCKNRFCVRKEHLYVGTKKDSHAQEYLSADGKVYKKCPFCKQVFEFTEEFFGKRGGWNGNLSPRCKKCRSLATREYERKNWHKKLFYAMKVHADKRNQELSITEEDLLDLYKEQNGKCYWLGVDLISSSISKFPGNISPDRLDSNKGYTKDNVVLCSVFANIGKNSCDLRTFIDYIKKNQSVFGRGIWKTDDKWKKILNCD